MINVGDYISMILTKKGWTRKRFCEELNSIEKKLGDKCSSYQLVSEYLVGTWEFRPKILAKWEKALGLSEGTLVNMVMPPITKEGREELKKVKDRLSKI